MSHLSCTGWSCFPCTDLHCEAHTREEFQNWSNLTSCRFKQNFWLQSAVVYRTVVKVRFISEKWHMMVKCLPRWRSRFQSLTRPVDDHCSDCSTNRIYRAGVIKLSAITGGAACVVCVGGWGGGGGGFVLEYSIAGLFYKRRRGNKKNLTAAHWRETELGFSVSETNDQHFFILFLNLKEWKKWFSWK